jgi:hypothetical protein
MNIAAYAKAIAPIGLMIVYALLSKVGVTPDMTVEQVLSLIGSSLLVYLVPNKQA